MADQLYLSYWLRNFGPLNMLQQYEKLLDTFPHSKLGAAPAVLRIHAVSWREPVLLETIVMDADAASVIAIAEEFKSPDACYELSTAWDLWDFDKDWKLAPARVALTCFGPEFETDLGESLRVDFGIEDRFLPNEEAPNSIPMIRANVQSLLRLVHDLDEKLPVEKRLLWPESGGNFADRLQSALE